MKIHLILFCALLVLLATAFDLKQCNYNDYEYLCLVESSCIVGGNAPVKTLVIYEPGNTLKNEKCSMMIKMKAISDIMWTIDFEYKDIQFKSNSDISVVLEGSFPRKLVKCQTSDGHGDFKRSKLGNHAPKLENGMWSGRCSYDITTDDTTVPRDMYSHFKAATEFRIEYLTIENALIKMTKFIGSMDDLAAKIAGTRGCDETLVSIITGQVDKGEQLPVNKRLIGRNAEINCNSNDADVLKIKLTPSMAWDPVQSVYCAGQVWAYHALNDTSKAHQISLGEQPFELKCIRDYCTFCGTVFPELCEQDCTPIKEPYVNCVPTCPDDLFYFANTVVKSKLECKELVNNPNDGVWKAKSNGVYVAVEMGSCYHGEFPLPKRPENTVKEEPKSSARAVAVWTIIVYNAVLWM